MPSKLCLDREKHASSTLFYHEEAGLEPIKMQDHPDKSPSSRPRILLRSGAVGVVLLLLRCSGMAPRESHKLQNRVQFAAPLPIFILCASLLSGCATAPDTREIISSYAGMKVEIPAPIEVEIRPIDVVCSGATCTMSAEDFLTHEADITALANVKRAYEAELQSRARAYNEAITSAMHRDIHAQHEQARAESLEKALDRERFGSALRQWLERAAFVLGIYVLSL